jgi:FkbM family methyltransferase
MNSKQIRTRLYRIKRRAIILYRHGNIFLHSFLHLPIRYKTLTGTSLFLLPSDQLSRWLYLDRFEQNELHFVRDYLHSGDTFIDAGANIGYYAIMASSLVQDEGRIFSFEPTSESYNCLFRSLKHFHYTNIEAFNIALSDRAEQRNFLKMKDGHSAWNTLGKPLLEGSYEITMVNCLTLDSILCRYSGHIDLIKVDVEGWEYRVLLGMEGILTEHRCDLLIEFSESNTIKADSSTKDTFDFLTSHGYRCYEIDSHARTLKSTANYSRSETINFLFTCDISKVINRTGYCSTGSSSVP